MAGEWAGGMGGMAAAAVVDLDNAGWGEAEAGVVCLVSWGKQLFQGIQTAIVLRMGCLIGENDDPEVKVERQTDGSVDVHLRGEFSLHMNGDHPFRLSMLMVFLGLLDVEGGDRKSRRTRDGRKPFVRQEQMATWFGQKQEHISQWVKYWLVGDWANLLSLKTAQVLTAELVEQIVGVCATFPTWSVEQVYRYLGQQGVKVSREQVEQGMQQSGWKQLQAGLLERYDLDGGMRLREAWLVEKLLTLVQTLLEKNEAGQGLSAEERHSLEDVQTLSAQAGVTAKPPLLGTWEETTDSTIHCTYCGSSDVAPKSKKPRLKKFQGPEGLVQEMPVVFRFYCHNPQCEKKSFTHFPAGLVPYSPYRTQVPLLAMQMVAWGYSTYRRTGTALGIYP